LFDRTKPSSRLGQERLLFELWGGIWMSGDSIKKRQMVAILLEHAIRQQILTPSGFSTEVHDRHILESIMDAFYFLLSSGVKNIVESQVEDLSSRSGRTYQNISRIQSVTPHTFTADLLSH